MSKVTAIVSAYYAEDYIEGRLENLKAQDAHPDIIVVCEHGSKEHDISRGFEGVDILTTSDVPTIYDAWNMAVSKATTDYITNANCDDRHYPGALGKLARLLDKHQDVGVIYSDIDIVEQIGGDPVSRFTWAEGGLEVLLRGCFLGPMPMWRRSLHEAHGMFDADMKIAGDYEFWLRLAAAGVAFKRLPIPQGAYLKRGDSLEHKEKVRAVWETARARGRYRNEVHR